MSNTNDLSSSHRIKNRKHKTEKMRSLPAVATSVESRSFLLKQKCPPVCWPGEPEKSEVFEARMAVSTVSGLGL